MLDGVTPVFQMRKWGPSEWLVNSPGLPREGDEVLGGPQSCCFLLVPPTPTASLLIIVVSSEDRSRGRCPTYLSRGVQRGGVLWREALSADYRLRQADK